VPRVLRVCFATAEIFRREHTDNLANGGVFVDTTEPFALREAVVIELVLQFGSQLRFDVVVEQARKRKASEADSNRD